MAKDKDESLKSLALRMGASVRLSNGEVFNAEGTRTRFKDEPARPQVDGQTELLKAILQLLSRPQASPQVVMPELPAPTVVVQPAEVHVQPAPQNQKPHGWKFTFERNESGTIRSITATPTP